MKRTSSIIKVRSHVIYSLTALFYLVGLISAFLVFMNTDAAAYGQITDRSLTLSSGIPSNTGVTYTFSFKPHDYTADSPPGTMSAVQSMKFVACANAVGTYPSGTCTAPVGMDGIQSTGDGFWNATVGTQTGWADAASFTAGAGDGSHCVQAANVICITRTASTAETTAAHTISFTGIKNPSTANTAFFVGMYTYTDGSWTTLTDFGATASAVVQTLTANAAVAEVLNFCIGATNVDDTTTAIASDCGGVSGSAVNIGTLDTSAINVSPVTVNGGNSENGVAMVRSNALNGLTVSYDAIPTTSVAGGDTDHLGTLRLAATNCDATNSFTDGCINAAGTTINNFTAGIEEFGMTVAGVNSGSTTSYSCAYGDTHAGTPIAAGNTCALEPTADYLGGGASTTEDYYRQADGLGNGFAWQEDGSATQIATASRAVDDEALILKFAATPSITTPFGPYSVQSDYIVVATY